MILVKAHLLQGSEFQFDPLDIQRAIKLAKKNALLKTLQIRHLMNQVVGKVSVELGALNSDRMVFKDTVALCFLWSCQDGPDLLLYFHSIDIWCPTILAI